MKLQEIIEILDPEQLTEIRLGKTKVVAKALIFELLEKQGFKEGTSPNQLMECEVEKLEFTASKLLIAIQTFAQKTAKEMTCHAEFENFLWDAPHIKSWAIDKIFDLYKNCHETQHECIAKESFAELENLFNEIGIAQHPFIEETMDRLMKNIELIYGWEEVIN